MIVVPPTLHPDGFKATRSTDEQFLDLLLADEDLLRAEFDAIIAAEWPGQPPGRPGRGTRAERRPGGTQRRRPQAAGSPGWPRPLRIGGWPRQRSPPRATGDRPTTRKAGDFPLLLIHPTRGDCSPRPPCFRHSASDRTLRRPRRPRTHPAGRTGQPPHAVAPAAPRPGTTTTTDSTRS